MTALDRFSQAAIEFARHDSQVSGFRKAPKCTERSRGDSVTGEAAVYSCDIHDPEASRCDNCQVRFDNRPAYETALKSRQLAKRKMMRWYPNLQTEVAQ